MFACFLEQQCGPVFEVTQRRLKERDGQEGRQGEKGAKLRRGKESKGGYAREGQEEQERGRGPLARTDPCRGRVSFLVPHALQSSVVACSHRRSLPTFLFLLLCSSKFAAWSASFGLFRTVSACSGASNAVEMSDTRRARNGIHMSIVVKIIFRPREVRSLSEVRGAAGCKPIVLVFGCLSSERVLSAFFFQSIGGGVPSEA